MLKSITPEECWNYFIDKRIIFYIVLYQWVALIPFLAEETESKDKPSNV